MEAVKQKIEAALKNLDVKGSVAIKKISIWRYIVFVNDNYFGIFDVGSNTFVD